MSPFTTLRDAAKSDLPHFEYPDPAGAVLKDGSIKMHSYVPHLELRGHLSDDLERDLEEGTVSTLELIKTQPAQQLAGNQYLLEDRLSLKVRVEKTLPRNGRLASLIAAMRTRKGQYKEGRIQFIDPNGGSKSISYDLDTGTPLQQMYVKYYKVDNISPPLDESSEHIVTALAGRMAQRVISDRL